MILLREPGLLFLKPHKVAGTSFEIALSAFAGPDDIVTPLGRRGREDEATRRSLGFAGPRNYRWPVCRLPFLPRGEWRIARRQRQWPGRFRSHLPAWLARDRLGEDLWRATSRISIVRNPFDTAVSTYYWSRRNGETFGDFWRRNAPLAGRNVDYYQIDGEEVIDLYLRFEAMNEGIAQIERRWPQLAGLGEIFGSIAAKSGWRPQDRSVASYFAEAPEVASLIETQCRFELDRFGYTLEA